VLHLKEENERLRRGPTGAEGRAPAAKRCPTLVGDSGDGNGRADSSSEAEAAAAAVEKQLVKEHTRCKPVRKLCRWELPRVEIEIVPPEVEREPDAFECIGSETRGGSERRPAAVVAVKLVYRSLRARTGSVVARPRCWWARR